MSTLNPEQWQELSPYLDQALTLAGEERARWLADLRAKDSVLAEQIQGLLDDHREANKERFLEANPPLPMQPGGFVGETVGAYCLLSVIGQGGMGMVWVAERSDGRFQRRAAVKFLSLGMGGRGALERFHREGAILGRLSHPHIAELLDAGITQTGRPYLVLEFVDGIPIHHYCDQSKLDVNARCRLFLDVLSAVAHAHASLIVHRDIKPSNVLVSRDGQVKLLDFGIAKLLEGEGSDGSATRLTHDAGSALTPEFAAPEQITGASVTTATDVYALGVLLYLLLSGQHPAGPGAHSAAGLVKAIVDTEPPRVSEVAGRVPVEASSSPAAERGATPERLRRQLKGDLDTILAKALKKDPKERYGSVGAFADDLQRFLTHEPISARPDSFTYRAGKFVHRNKVGVFLSALVLIGVASAFIAIRAEARRAEYRFQQVRKLAHTVLFDVNPQIELLAGSTPARELLVKTSLEYLDSLATEAGHDPRLQLELAEAYDKIGDVQGNPNYANLGHSDAAVESYGKAAAIACKLGSAPGALEVLATAYSSMGTVQARQLGLRSAGRENLRQATTIADSIPRLTGKPAYRLRLLAYGLLGDLDVNIDPVRAADPIRHSLDIAREWASVEPEREPKFFVAVLTREWADILWETGDLKGARSTLLESLAAFKEVLNQDPNNGDWLREQYLAEEWMGLVSGHPDFFNFGERKVAAEWLRSFVHNCERLMAADPGDVRARSNLSEGLALLADVYRQSDAQTAEMLYQRALTLSSSALESDPQNSEILHTDSSDRLGFASLLEQSGKHKLATDQWQHAITILETLRKRDSTDISVAQLLGVALHKRASSLVQRSEFVAAQQDLEHSEEILSALYQQNPNNLMILRDLADCYRAKGNLATHRSKWNEAQLEYQKSLELWERWTKIGTSSIYDQRQREMTASLVRQVATHHVPHPPRQGTGPAAPNQLRDKPEAIRQ